MSWLETFGNVIVDTTIVSYLAAPEVIHHYNISMDYNNLRTQLFYLMLVGFAVKGYAKLRNRLDENSRRIGDLEKKLSVE